MASIQFIGQDSGNNVKEVLQAFYGNAKEIPSSNCAENAVFITGDNYYPHFSIVGDEKLLAYVYESEKDDARLLIEEVSAITKRDIKRIAYLAISKYTNVRWSWGALSGIRPSTVASGLLKDYSVDETIRILHEDYQVSETKTRLLLETTQIENKILDSVEPNSYGIYIGVPFCPTKCWYCSFTTEEAIGKSPVYAAQYLDILELEIEDFLRWHKNTSLAHLAAIYVGGGTPADMPDFDFGRLIDLISRLPIRSETEITIELGRVDVINMRKLELLKSSGISRICINPQSLNPEVLSHLGRNTHLDQIINIYEMAKAIGFDAINLDFIAGLPFESKESFVRGIQQATKWGAEEISIHTLALKRGSKQYSEHYAGNRVFDLKPSQELMAMIEDSHTLLMHEAYKPYYLYRHRLGLSGLENVSFAKDEKYCIYNVLMMADQHPIVSFGSPAISKNIINSKAKRLAASKSFFRYLKTNKEYLHEKEKLFLYP